MEKDLEKQAETEVATRVKIPYRPRPLQKAVHETDRRFVVLVCHRRFGKALALDTPVPMADGTWATMGDIEAGDQLLGSDGLPVTVQQAHDVMVGRPCYEVSFSCGENIVADAEHLWDTTEKKDRHNYVRLADDRRVNRPRPASTKTTQQIAETLKARGECNHRVALAGPAAYPAQSLPIEPYLLGLWLGDGTSATAAITTPDQPVVDAFRDHNAAWRVAPTKQQAGGLATTYRINGGFQTDLRVNGLLNNKHIPEVYLRASARQRLALLQGLCDTDGSINKQGNYVEITQKRQQVADGIASLVRSLGMVVHRDIKRVNGADYHRLTFRPMINVFRLPKKAGRWVPPPERLRWRSIADVRPVDSVPVRCLTVDAEDQLFLVGRNYIPTHNTVLSVNKLIKGMLTCPLQRPRFAYIAPLYRQAKQVAWDYCKYYTRHVPMRRVQESELRIDIGLNDSRLQLFGADNPDALRGIYLDGVVMDEFAQMPPRLWPEVIRPVLSDRRGWALFIGTPQGHNQFYELYHDALTNGWADWDAAIYRASDTGIIPEDELAAQRAVQGPDVYAQEFECSFEAAIKGAYYGRLMREASEDGRITQLPHQPEAQVHTAWDIGIGDSTAIWFFQYAGNKIHLVDYLENSGEGVEWYVRQLQAKPYAYGQHWAPHDIRVREWGTGRSRAEAAMALGVRFEMVPQVSFDDGIQAARLIVPRSVFDVDRCHRGIECLRQYRTEFNEDRKAFSQRPRHDEYSHGADAFRYLSLAVRDRLITPEPRLQPTFNDIVADHLSLNRRGSDDYRRI